MPIFKIFRMPLPFVTLVVLHDDKARVGGTGRGSDETVPAQLSSKIALPSAASPKCKSKSVLLSLSWS